MPIALLRSGSAGPVSRAESAPQPTVVRLARSPLARAAFAVLTAAAALLAYYWLNTLFGFGLPYLTFSPAVMIAALLGGAWAGLVSTAASALLVALFVLAHPLRAVDAVPLVGFCALGAVMSVIAGLYRTARQRLAAYEKDRALHASQEQFRALFHNAAVGVTQLDVQGRFVLVNARFCEITGYSPQELAAMTPVDLSPPEDQEREGAFLGRFLAGQTSRYEAEKRYVRKDGTIVWVHATGGQMRDAEGRLTGAAGVIEDISARHDADEASRRRALDFQTLADNIAQLAWMADETGATFWYSRRWYEYTGTTPEQMQREGWQAVVHPDDAPHVADAARRRLADGEPWEETFRMRAGDGGYRWFLTRVVPVRDDGGRVVRWLGTSTDVTQQHDDEQALREADQRKNEFLAVLSHELRNPLAPIRNSVYVLQRTQPGSSQAVRALAVIDRQSQQLSRLVDDLLDVTRIGRGKIRLQKEQLDINSVVRRAAEDHRDEFAQSGVEFDVALAPEPLFVHGDSTRLAQVVGNILRNAAKFTPRGGRTAMSVQREDGRALVRIRDTGAGIEPATLETIFDAFVQGDLTVERSKGGLGLGLALVKGIVELHGGTVSAHSEGHGRGAEFRVSLPLQPAPAPAPPPRRRRVLIVEDSFDTARSLKEALELSGHDVEIALTGPEGMQAARRFRPHVIVCDIGLPDMDGLAVARAVRADPLLHDTALVALSGYALEEDLERCRAAGFDRHVAKPADPAAVERTVADLTA